MKLTNGPTVILEIKGHDELEGVKIQAAERWVRAVNADGRHGEWRYALTHNPNEVPHIVGRVAEVQAPVIVTANS